MILCCQRAMYRLATVCVLLLSVSTLAWGAVLTSNSFQSGSHYFSAL